MKARLDRLNVYLHESCKLPTEMFRVYVENGVASALFHEEALFEAMQDELGAVAYHPQDPQTRFYGKNAYQISLHVRHYGGDVDTLLHLLLYWLHSEQQALSLPYVLEVNNNQTVDLWLDLAIEEGSRDQDGGVHTC